MELKEYLQIIKKDIKVFLLLIIFAVSGSLAFFHFQPVSFNTSLALNITRRGTLETTDYRYDSFYRLQADERFAGTVTEWLKTPRIVADVYEMAKINPVNFSLTDLSKSLNAERKSSQLVDVNFSSATPESAQRISSAMVKIISRNTEKLNEEQREANWFLIIAENPLTTRNVPNHKIIFLVSFLGGLFLSFWTVLIRHYLK